MDGLSGQSCGGIAEPSLIHNYIWHSFEIGEFGCVLWFLCNQVFCCAQNDESAGSFEDVKEEVGSNE